MNLAHPPVSALRSLGAVLLVSLCWGLGGSLSLAAVQNLSPAAAAFGRCGFALLALLPFLVLDGRRLIAGLGGRGLSLLAASGTLLGIHFYFFIAGVAYSSLATAVTLVAVEPVLILAVGALLFQERLTVRQGLAIGICVLGVLVIGVCPLLLSASAPPSLPAQAPGPSRVWGMVCALSAVLTYAGYYALNRLLKPLAESPLLPGGFLRRGLGLAAVVYLFASGSAGLLVLGTAESPRGGLGSLQPAVWGALIAMGLIPTLVGHSLSQMLSRRLHPIWISLMSPGETLLSLGMGWIFFDQTLGGAEAAGGALIGIGVLTALREEIRLQKAPDS